ncbi:MAG: apolipoprotein N-acyltransferase, partial [Campylobacteraceae bacterium]|nr:apolipoprotein N-acyltransferase [Campylobacteraceae bacterium]
MKLRSFPLAYESFSRNFLKVYSTTSIIIKAFVTALCLSAFIYLAFLNVTNPLLHAAFAIAGFWLLFGSSRLGYFLSGFFVGIFWFYWISLSFRYYGGLSWAIPLVITFVACVYGVMFLSSRAFTSSPYLQALFLLLLSQLAPFGFNWFNFELMLYYTPFGLTPLHTALLMAAVLSLKYLRKYYKILALFLLIAALDFSNKELPTPLDFDVELAHTSIPQGDKWESENIIQGVLENFEMIEEAIRNDKRLIIFPETAFALYLNKNEVIVNRLLEYSNDIAIITGALAYDEDNKSYNSAYFFDRGAMKRADKVVLVPFSEKVPLPNFISFYINKIFFNGASDFQEAPNPTDFEIDGVKIRSAVCFEGSTPAIHKDEPKVISVISNNAWFLPSIEPTMQNLMLALYA